MTGNWPALAEIVRELRWTAFTLYRGPRFLGNGEHSLAVAARDRAVLRALMERARAGDERSRERGINTLASVGAASAAMPVIQAEIIGELVGRLQNEAEVELVRTSAAKALGAIGAMAPKLVDEVVRALFDTPGDVPSKRYGSFNQWALKRAVSGALDRIAATTDRPELQELIVNVLLDRLRESALPWEPNALAAIRGVRASNLQRRVAGALIEILADRKRRRSQQSPAIEGLGALVRGGVESDLGDNLAIALLERIVDRRENWAVRLLGLGIVQELMSTRPELREVTAAALIECIRARPTQVGGLTDDARFQPHAAGHLAALAVELPSLRPSTAAVLFERMVDEAGDDHARRSAMLGLGSIATASSELMSSVVDVAVAYFEDGKANRSLRECAADLFARLIATAPELQERLFRVLVRRINDLTEHQRLREAATGSLGCPLDGETAPPGGGWQPGLRELANEVLLQRVLDRHEQEGVWLTAVRALSGDGTWVATRSAMHQQGLIDVLLEDLDEDRSVDRGKMAAQLLGVIARNTLLNSVRRRVVEVLFTHVVSERDKVSSRCVAASALSALAGMVDGLRERTVDAFIERLLERDEVRSLRIVLSRELRDLGSETRLRERIAVALLKCVNDEDVSEHALLALAAFDDLKFRFRASSRQFEPIDMSTP